MNNRKHNWTIFGTTAVCCLALLTIFAIGCEKKSEEQATDAADQEKKASEVSSDQDVKVPAAPKATELPTIPGTDTKVPAVPKTTELPTIPGTDTKVPAAPTVPSTDVKTPTTTTPCVNNTCPIMGNKIDPTKVPDNLTRTYKNQKVGFCCAGCPVAWDKLSDAEKTAKLAKVMSK